MYVQMPPLGRPSGRNEDPNDATNPLNAPPTSPLHLTIPFRVPHQLSLSPVPSPPHHHRTPLASSNRRPRNNITRRHRPVQLKQQPRIRRLIRAREANQLPRRLNPARPTSDLDLRTAHVKLRAADTPGRMQRNVLDAEQVLAVLDALGDLHAYLLLACPTVSSPTTKKGGRGTNQH